MAKFWQSVEVKNMTDIQRAMLGDHDAAARLTEQGVLIPCRCGATPTLFGGRFNTGGAEYHCIVVCQCRSRTNMCEGRRAAILEWNTRTPLLTPEQIDMLERMESEE